MSDEVLSKAESWLAERGYPPISGGDGSDAGAASAFSFTEFQKGVTDAVASGLATGLARQDAKDAGHFVTADGETKTFDQFLRAVATKDTAALKALATATGASGGYTVPTQWVGRLLKIRGEKAIVRPRATVFSIDEGTQIDIPILDQSCSPEGDESAFYSCINFQWTQEGGLKSETEPTFQQRKLLPHELSGYVEITDKLLKTSGLAFQSVIENLFGDGIRHAEDYYFLRGNGVGQPMGVLNCTGTYECTRDTTDQITAADLFCMAHHMLPGGSPVWVITHCGQEELWSLADALGNLLFMDKDLTKAPSGTLMGWPIVWSEKLPPLGTSGDILLADFSYYDIGDLGGVEIDASPHFKFTSNITVLRCVLYTDGHCRLDAPIELMNGEQVSPFVILTT